MYEVRHGSLVLILMVFVAMIAAACDPYSDQQREQWRTQLSRNDLAREAYLKDHNCRVETYVGRNPQPMYLCDGGLRFIWRDIPIK